VNPRNPAEITIPEFAKEIVALSESKSLIEHRPLPPYDQKLRKPDITPAYQLLGWEPKSTARKESSERWRTSRAKWQKRPRQKKLKSS
jgi:nucleoside-diphosphate-sugar epimerase